MYLIKFRNTTNICQFVSECCRQGPFQLGCKRIAVINVNNGNILLQFFLTRHNGISGLIQWLFCQTG